MVWLIVGTLLAILYVVVVNKFVKFDVSIDSMDSYTPLSDDKVEQDIVYPFNVGDSFDFTFNIIGNTRHIVISEYGHFIATDGSGRWYSLSGLPQQISNYVSGKKVYLGGE